MPDPVTPVSSADHPILVTGSTGYVGGRLIGALLERGEHVRALARRPGKLRGRAFSEHPNLEIVEGDLGEPASVSRAVAGACVAYYLVHSMGSGGHGDAFASVDTRYADCFARACAAAEVGRIVYLGGLGRRDDALSLHLRSRQETGDALRAGAGAATPVTELRAGVIVGSGSASFEIARDLSHKLPVMVTPRWVRSLVEPIAIRNVVQYLVGVLDEPRAVGEVLDIGGGEVLPYADLLRICAEEQGRHVLLLPVPVLTPRLSSYWLHLVTSVDIRVARPLVEGLRNDAVCEDRRIRDWIPVELLPFRTAVRLALAKGTRDVATVRRESRWTDAEPARAASVADGGAAPDAYRDSRTFTTDLTPAETFARVCAIGGERGYGRGADVLWKLRGALDRLVGGVGLRRGRPPGGDLHEGDVVDFWRVVEIDPPRRLVLVAEMRVPGQARLAFTVEPADGGGSILHQDASLSRTSVLSGIYWRAIDPLHTWVFGRLGRHLLEGRRDA